MITLFVASEAAPYSKTGGLGDVAGALPYHLARDHRVTMAIPYYKNQSCSAPRASVADRFEVPLGERTYPTRILQARLTERLTVLLVEQDVCFARRYIYGHGMLDYPDNAQRFTLFQLALLIYLIRQRLTFHLIHLNDWQTALLPLLARFGKQKLSARRPRFLLTIHNIAYQGVFSACFFPELELPERFFSIQHLEFHGRINWLKGGIIHADRITTVSPGHAGEIVTADYGFGLDGVLKQQQRKLSGIMNGVDYSQWNPAEDPHIPFHYTASTLAQKAKNKAWFIQEHRLPFASEDPLAIVISRLSRQKGIDLLLEALPNMTKARVNVVVLGTGDTDMEETLTKLSGESDRLHYINRFDEVMAHRMQAAGDILLMPSRYEPCGLTQLFALRYGTIPLVRKTGGLADSVEAFDPASGNGTGFVFEEATSASLGDCLKTALKLFADRKTWRNLQKNAMSADFSWERAAESYLTLYHRLRKERDHG